MQQSTRDALISSEPHAQKPPDVSKSYVQNISAFFSEDYFNPKSSMNSDDSLDTYYAADDDTIRGSGYKKPRWPRANFAERRPFIDCIARLVMNCTRLRAS